MEPASRLSQIPGTLMCHLTCCLCSQKTTLQLRGDIHIHNCLYGTRAPTPWLAADSQRTCCASCLTLPLSWAEKGKEGPREAAALEPPVCKCSSIFYGQYSHPWATRRNTIPVQVMSSEIHKELVVLVSPGHLLALLPSPPASSHGTGVLCDCSLSTITSSSGEGFISPFGPVRTGQRTWFDS